MSPMLPDDHVEYTPLTQEEKDILALQDDPVFLRELVEIASGERRISRARVAELEAQAKDVETHGIMADYKRDELRAALREIGEIVGVSLSADAAHEAHASVVDDVRRSLCYNRDRVVELESRAKAHAEALVIAHGVGAASRNGEVRSRAAEFSAFVSHEYAEALSARNSALSRLWDSQRLKDNYSSELKVVIGERDALKAENDILESAEEAGCTASRNKCMDELAQMLGIDADPLSDEHITGAVDELLGRQVESKALLADAQIYVREVMKENAAGWGERLMHKQQPAIDCDAAITAFLGGK